MGEYMVIKCPKCKHDISKDVKYLPLGGYCPKCGSQLAMAWKTSVFTLISGLTLAFLLPTLLKNEEIGRLMIWISIIVIFILPMSFTRVFGYRLVERFNNEKTVMSETHDIDNIGISNSTLNIKFTNKLGYIAIIFSNMLFVMSAGGFITSRLLEESTFNSILTCAFMTIFFMLLLSMFLIMGDSKFLYNILYDKYKRVDRLIPWFGLTFIATSLLFRSLIDVIFIMDGVVLIVTISPLLFKLVRKIR